MARIKVTGYVPVTAIDPGDLDLDHKSGVSEDGFESGLSGLCLTDLEDAEYLLVEND